MWGCNNNNADNFNKGRYGQAQLNWLANTAVSFDEDGWSIIVMTHANNLLKKDTYSIRDERLMFGILNAYAKAESYQGTYSYVTTSPICEGDWANVSINVDYRNTVNRGEIIGMFTGHCHLDKNVTQMYQQLGHETPENLPFPVISIESANFIGSYDIANQEKQQNNSDKETAIDAVVIDLNNKKINQYFLLL